MHVPIYIPKTALQAYCVALARKTEKTMVSIFTKDEIVLLEKLPIFISLFLMTGKNFPEVILFLFKNLCYTPVSVCSLPTQLLS